MERFTVRVKGGRKVEGYSISGAPALVQPGEYVVHWLSTNRLGSTVQESALRFLRAHETRSGDDVHVFAADIPELKEWPDLSPNGPFESLA